MRRIKWKLPICGYAAEGTGPRPWVVVASVCGLLFLSSLPVIGYIWQFTHPIEAARSRNPTGAALRFETALRQPDDIPIVQSNSASEQWLLVSPTNSDEEWLHEVTGLSPRLCRALAAAPRRAKAKHLLARIVDRELVSAEYVGVWFPISTFGNTVRSPTGTIVVFEGGGIVRNTGTPRDLAPDN